MCNSFKSVREIINELPALSDYLLDADSYYAHLPNKEFQRKETLEEHVRLVNSYLERLVTCHQLDVVIDKLINRLVENLNQEKGGYIKCLFVHTIVFHDFGKINESFQFEKMDNLRFEKSVRASNPIGQTHSSLGAYIYLTKHLNDIVFHQKGDPLLIACCLFFSYSIFKHHGQFLDDTCLATITFSDFKARNNWEDVKKFLNAYLDKYQMAIHPNVLNLIGREEVVAHPAVSKYIDSFELYLLCRLNYSLLTASDYLATNEYMNSLVIEDLGILSKERISELYFNVTQRERLHGNKTNYNKMTYDGLNNNYKFRNPQEKSGQNLNILRKEMALEVIKNIRENHENNLFFIEAPTGGGKTNLSILATIELLHIYQGRYNKVFYVFPFTTLITQTYSVVKDMLGLDDDEIIALHSKSGLKKAGEDDEYGYKKINYINHLFVNYPICLLSHIRFFDILKTNEKEANYLLHRLANSIVIIDELQSYNPSHWDKIIYFIRQYASSFNIKFILMSATLPKLDKLKVIKQNVDDFVYLLPHAKHTYFNNPNFSKRIHFNFDLFNRTDLSLNELAEKLLSVSLKYSKYDFGEAKMVDSVYTIIEFIYKQSATDFYDIIKEYYFFDEIFVLSGTILEFRRKEIINNIKSSIYRKKKILLITTQVVEAGVDIDMDLGFKDRSIIDSDEQLAGRINRNINKEYCELYLFNYNKESVIYRQDYRYRITKESIGQKEYRRILETKDFDALYNQIFENQNRWNETEMAENFSDYEHSLRRLKFRTVHERFKLIETCNFSCFIPMPIPLFINKEAGEYAESVFTFSELEFLKENGIFPNEKNEIEGDKVFDLYIKSIYNKIDFTQQQIRKKVLQSLLSKYTFSVFANDKIERTLMHFYDKEKSAYGYLYLSRWKDIYSVEKGLDAKRMGGVEETLFL